MSLMKSINDNMKDDDESICTSETVIGNSDCGEPFVGQRILLDFTPNDEDNDAVQAKCCAFWEFINNQPEFKIRQPSQESISNNSGSKIASTSRKSNIVPLRREKTAVSMLEFVEEKGLINRAFESTLPTSYCNIELKDYINKLSITEMSSPRLKDSDKLKKVKDRSEVTSGTVHPMCQKLLAWDLEHPKSMEPPGPVPELHEYK